MNLLFNNPKSLLLVALLILGVTSSAQVLEIGGHSGINASRFTIEENKLNDAVFLRQGRTFNAFNFGAQIRVSPARKQSSAYWRWIPSALFEANLCRCGGFMELSLTSGNGVTTFNELKYIIYRGEYSAKFMGTLGPFQFMAGPTISNRFYTGVTAGNSGGLKYAGNQFKVLSFAYEVGAGVQFNLIHFSARFQRYIGAYSKSIDAIPTEYKHYQLRFMVHYYLFRRERGKNWNSIYWD